MPDRKLDTVVLHAEQEAPDPSTGARVMVAKKDYDFGSVIEGNRVCHDFLIQNQRGCRLRIRRIEADEDITIVMETKTTGSIK